LLSDFRLLRRRRFFAIIMLTYDMPLFHYH
jgi:hypothetical protein